MADDGGTRGSAAFLRRNLPTVKVVALGRNGGFVAAVTAGLSQSRAELFFLLNNDTVVEPSFYLELRPQAPHRIA